MPVTRLCTEGGNSFQVGEIFFRLGKYFYGEQDILECIIVKAVILANLSKGLTLPPPQLQA